MGPFTIFCVGPVWSVGGQGRDWDHLYILVCQDNGNNIKRLMVQLLLMNSTGLPNLNEPTIRIENNKSKTL